MDSKTLIELTDRHNKGKRVKVNTMTAERLFKKGSCKIIYTFPENKIVDKRQVVKWVHTVL